MDAETHKWTEITRKASRDVWTPRRYSTLTGSEYGGLLLVGGDASTRTDGASKDITFQFLNDIWTTTPPPQDCVLGPWTPWWVKMFRLGFLFCAS